jgi:hypothetical protein
LLQPFPQIVEPIVVEAPFTAVSETRYDDAAFRLRFARLVTHYWRHAAFLDEEQLLRDAPTLDGIPGVLVHGRYDVSGPLETAWRLSHASMAGRRSRIG